MRTLYFRAARSGAGGSVLAVILACSASDRPATSPHLEAAAGPTFSAAPFACGAEYTAVSTIEDATLANYGMSAVTDTSYVCESWTGNDYRVYTRQLGSSEPPSPTSDSLKTVEYSGGYAYGNAGDGTQMGDPAHVGSTSFEFLQATPEEQQASYNDPYYGVTASGGSGACPHDPNAFQCVAAYSRTPMSPNLSRSPTAGLLRNKEHGVRRSPIRALLSGMDETTPAPSGNRRFRSVKGDEETILEIDPVTELIAGQEYRSPRGHSRATLRWKMTNGRYVREHMEVVATDIIGGRPFNSRHVIRILNLKMGGQ